MLLVVPSSAIDWLMPCSTTKIDLQCLKQPTTFAPASLAEAVNRKAKDHLCHRQKDSRRNRHRISRRRRHSDLPRRGGCRIGAGGIVMGFYGSDTKPAWPAATS
jgi:hypothetical protein